MSPSEIGVAVGRITEVHRGSSGEIFMLVELQGYMAGNGEPLMARVRWCSPYAGAGYGDWHIPDVGRAVLCQFPGIQTHRSAGGDLDEGFAHAYASFTDAPPVDGLQADLSATNRVLRGKDGVAEDRETRGAMTWVLRAAAQWLCDAVQTFTGTQVLIVCGDVQIGSGSLEKLLNETALATFNAHVHAGVQTGGGSTAPPTQQMQVGTDTTSDLTAS